jgi:hypothetical protein
MVVFRPLGTKNPVTLPKVDELVLIISFSPFQRAYRHGAVVEKHQDGKFYVHARDPP